MIIPNIESNLAELLAAATAAYLLGSISFGILAARLMGATDPRTIGSGNTGATNVLRTGSKAAAALTLLLDAAKGALPVAVCYEFLAADAAQLAGLAAFLGHLFPAWHGFKGGKGVATFFGILLAVAPLSGCAACLAWLAMAAVFRISSLAALSASLASPALAWMSGSPDAVVLCAALAVMIWIRHASNIRRLLAGKESRIKLTTSK